MIFPPGPVPAPRKKPNTNGSKISITDDDEFDVVDVAPPHSSSSASSVQQRIHQLEEDHAGGGGDVSAEGVEAGATSNGHKTAPRKRRPNSEAFKLFESTGMIISMVSIKN